MKLTTALLLISIPLTLTACQTTKLSDANRAAICVALKQSRVSITAQELKLLSPATIRQIKANPAIQRSIGCV